MFLVSVQGVENNIRLHINACIDKAKMALQSCAPKYRENFVANLKCETKISDWDIGHCKMYLNVIYNWTSQKEAIMDCLADKTQAC